MARSISVRELQELKSRKKTIAAITKAIKKQGPPKKGDMTKGEKRRAKIRGIAKAAAKIALHTAPDFIADTVTVKNVSKFLLRQALYSAPVVVARGIAEIAKGIYDHFWKFGEKQLEFEPKNCAGIHEMPQKMEQGLLGSPNMGFPTGYAISKNITPHPVVPITDFDAWRAARDANYDANAQKRCYVQKRTEGQRGPERNSLPLSGAPTDCETLPVRATSYDKITHFTTNVLGDINKKVVDQAKNSRIF